MTKDYVTIQEEIIDVLGHKVKAVRERFNDKYLDSDRFQSPCIRCCFNKPQKSLRPFGNEKQFCNFIKCQGYSRDEQTHFEIIK